jgi:hypothetical protein
MTLPLANEKPGRKSFDPLYLENKLGKFFGAYLH